MQRMADLLPDHLFYEEQLALPHEDQLAYIENMMTLATSQVPASELQKHAMIALRDQARNHEAVVEREDAQGSNAIPTPYDRLRWALDEIAGQLDLQKGEGIAEGA